MVAAVKVLLQLGQIPASTPGDKAAHSSCCLCMWTIKSSLVPADLHLIPSRRHSNNKFECSDSGPADYFLYRDRLASLTCLTNIISTYLIDLTDRLQPCSKSGFRPIPATDEEHQAALRAYLQAVDAIPYASTVTRPPARYIRGTSHHFLRGRVEVPLPLFN